MVHIEISASFTGAMLYWYQSSHLYDCLSFPFIHFSPFGTGTAHYRQGYLLVHTDAVLFKEHAARPKMLRSLWNPQLQKTMPRRWPPADKGAAERQCHHAVKEVWKPLDGWQWAAHSHQVEHGRKICKLPTPKKALLTIGNGLLFWNVWEFRKTYQRGYRGILIKLWQPTNSKQDARHAESVQCHTRIFKAPPSQCALSWVPPISENRPLGRS